MEKRGNFISGAIFITLGVILYVVASEPREILFADPNAMDIMLYPKILIAIWIGASVIYTIGPREKHDFSDLWNARIPLLKAVFSIALYMGTFSLLGLFLSTFLFLLVFFWFMNYRQPLKMICIALGCAALSWFVFEFLLGIVMPKGIFMDVFAE